MLLSVPAFCATGCAANEASLAQKDLSVIESVRTESQTEPYMTSTEKSTTSDVTKTSVSAAHTSKTTVYAISTRSETIQTVANISSTVNNVTIKTTLPKSSVVSGYTMKGWVRECFNANGNTAVVQVLTNKQNKCYLIDQNDGNIISSKDIGSTLNSVLGTFSDETLVCVDDTNRNLLLFDPITNQKNTVSMGKDRDIFSMWLDPVKDHVYWTQNDNLIRSIDRNGKITETATDEFVKSVDQIYPERNAFLANEYSEDAIHGVQPALYSLDTGTRMFALNTDSPYNSGFTKDKFYDISTSFEDGMAKINVYDLATSKFEKQYTFSCKNTTPFFISSNNSNDIIITEFASSGKGNLQSVEYLNLITGEVYESGINVKSGNYINVTACCNAAADRWLFTLDKADARNGENNFQIVDASALKYSKTLISNTVQKVKAKRYEVGAGYKTVKAEAEKIEKEFGVRILVGDEVFNAEVNAGFKFHSTESYIDASEMITTLHELRTILSEYPQGFFAHFKMKNNKFGLRISLVEELESVDYDSFSAAGVAYQTGPWYEIAVEHFYINDHTVLHHEMWHIVEDLVSAKYPLDESAWKKLNPAGHSYTHDFDGYATNTITDLNTLSQALMTESPNYKTIYFARDYSHVTPMEDRATLIEALFTWSCGWNTVNDPISEMYSYPHLKAKLDYLANYSKQEFGYVYWEEMLQSMENAA